MSHTPGPWRINKYQGIGGGVDGVTPPIVSADGWAHDWDSYERDRHDSDIRLIAASPDLLEFAKDVHAYLDALPNLPDNDELAQFADRAEVLIKAVGR